MLRDAKDLEMKLSKFLPVRNATITEKISVSASGMTV